VREILDGVWHTLTGETPGPVELTGAEDVLPGPYRVAAGEMLKLREIEPGVVTADTRHAAAAFASEGFSRVEGASPESVWAPLSGNYRTADGWVRLHCNYPRHEAAVCWGLGVPGTREAVEKAVAGRGAREVEHAVVSAGGAAAQLRSPADWAAHPQGSAVASLPLVDLAPIGEAPKRTLFYSDRPLGGIRILELTHVLAGPVAGRVLAAHGADVLHVGAAHLPRVEALVRDTGQGKRSAFVALDTEGGRARLKKLISRADVLVQSFRPGALSRIGFGPAERAELRPGLVIADLSAYGWEGPWARRRGFDSLVQMSNGIAWDGSGDPAPLPVQALDHGTGWLAAAAVMTALHRQVTDGGTWRVRLSLAGTGRWLDSLGRKDPAGADVEFGDLLEDVDSGYGRLTRVRMAGGLPGAEPHWDFGTRLPGVDKPTWTP
jgi:crotonobetainyl-CoA:carnitine CoA-transferase CaiB-like acyl-CoA transferase